MFDAETKLCVFQNCALFYRHVKSYKNDSRIF